MIILIFILAHWVLAGFFQTFFLHRYAAHKMFTTSKFNERVFYFLTFICEGSSFTTPKGYAMMHREHHAFSDTEKDPHSPLFSKNVFIMLWGTITYYFAHAKWQEEPETEFKGYYPEWPLIDRIGSSWFTRVGFGLFYVAFYIVFATHWWMFLFLPIHFFMQLIQGSVVNWCGHKYGYTNFDNHDHSKNSHPLLGVLFFGELLQNNHHRYPNSPNFSLKWFESDGAYLIMRFFDSVGIIKLRKPGGWRRTKFKTA